MTRMKNLKTYHLKVMNFYQKGQNKNMEKITWSKIRYKLRCSYTPCGGPGGSSGKALSYGLGGPGVEIFLRSFVSRLVLGSTQPPIK